jgi:hypothetical protein
MVVDSVIPEERHDRGGDHHDRGRPVPDDLPAVALLGCGEPAG